MLNYGDFLAGKRIVVESAGIEVPAAALNPVLFDFQRDITLWALKLGRAAVFADCGLGKTLIQLEWARQVGAVLIVAPLSVADQTIDIACNVLGLSVNPVETASDLAPGINITNYEKLYHFTGAPIDGIVLDESSILKSIDGKTRTRLLEEFTYPRFRLCCTATPAPNDIAELANHAEFLGHMRRVEMLAAFFVHDDEGWRLRGHALKPFCRWLASWSVMLKSPADLGYDASGFQLPPLSIEESIVKTEWRKPGELFAGRLHGITDRIDVRQKTVVPRTDRVVEIIRESWINEKKSSQQDGNGIDGIEGSILAEQAPNTTPILSQQSSERDGIEPLSQQSIGKIGASSKSTASLSKKRGPSLNSKGTDALFAESLASSDERVLISTTTIGTMKSEDFFAQVATKESGDSGTIPTPCAAPPFTSKRRQWLVWCGLNTEQSRLEKLLGDDCVSIEGSTPMAQKVQREKRWRSGEVSVLLTKPKIFGHGMNWQHCQSMIFVGLSDSYEQYYQAIRREWRYGQKHPVRAVIVVTDHETEIVANVREKEMTADSLSREVIAAAREYETANVRGVQAVEQMDRAVYEGPDWKVIQGDCIEAMAEMPESSIDLSVFSPPFSSLYTYSASENDIGNCRDLDEFVEHFDFAVAQLLRITKPGRLCVMHLAQVATTLVKDGVIGVRDLRGALIVLFARTGWTFHGEITIDKNPQAQAIRTHSKALLFVQLHKDASWLRPALADYVLLFRKPGDNLVPIKPDITHDEWIQWARPVWYDIQETDTLNVAEARENEDDRHICPLQLGLIERAVRLWSNPGELVFSPFGGIGSEGYVALQNQRRALLVELKPRYAATAVKNLKRALKAKSQIGLFEQATA